MRRMTMHCDVLVIGLGPAGASAAAAAAAAGLSVIALDRKKVAGQPVQCAEFVPALIANEVPVSSAVVQPITAMHTYLENLPRHEQPNFPGLMISREAFDAGLIARAQDAGATILLGRRVAQVGDDGCVHLAGGEGIKASVLIAADGPRSVVGAACGRINERLVETRQITVELHDPHEATDIFLSARLPGGYGWLFPKSDYANVGVGVDERYRARLKTELERLHHGLVQAGRVGRVIRATTGGAIPAGGPIDPVASLGDVAVLLAGDAAGLANPITGAGISAAVISGQLAGATAARNVRGDPDALAFYREDLADTFAAASKRALRRRAELMAEYELGNDPSLTQQRRGWIAYKHYWTEAPVREAAHDLLEA